MLFWGVAVPCLPALFAIAPGLWRQVCPMAFANQLPRLLGFGRALGARSILGDARSESMQRTLNLRVKYRESFRPFAPAVLREDVSDWFEIASDSPYMLLTADVRKEIRREMTAAERALFGIDQLNVPRPTIPAVTHVDYSARVQTVDAERNPRLHGILSRFKALTGSAVIINTSFNVRGEPIVNTPADAYRCFLGTNMDALVLENFVLLRQEQPQSQQTVSRDEYLAQFSLD